MPHLDLLRGLQRLETEREAGLPIMWNLANEYRRIGAEKRMGRLEEIDLSAIRSPRRLRVYRAAGEEALVYFARSRASGNWRVQEAKGRHNASPSPQLLRALHAWCDQHGVRRLG